MASVDTTTSSSASSSCSDQDESVLLKATTPAPPVSVPSITTPQAEPPVEKPAQAFPPPLVLLRTPSRLETPPPPPAVTTSSDDSDDPRDFVVVPLTPPISLGQEMEMSFTPPIASLFSFFTSAAERRFSSVSLTTGIGIGRRVCRICWDGGDAEALVSSGCRCHDSFVHQSCLLRWVETNKRKDPVVCEICLAKYEVPFDGQIQDILVKLKEEEAQSQHRRRHRQARHGLTANIYTLNPCVAKVVLAMSICLILVAILLVITYVVVFTMSLAQETAPTTAP